MLILNACTTTSDIVTLSDNSYQVSSLACPACGGTSKSQDLARQKANDFCAEQGGVAIIDNLDNETVNAYGAGATALNFRCGQANAQDTTDACYKTLASGLKDIYGDELVESVGPKLFPSEENFFGFEQLADTSMPSEQEKEFIKKFGAGSSKCERTHAESMPISRQKMWLSAENRRLTALAQLANGQINYGDYAASLNDAYENLYASEDDYLRRQADEAKRDAAEQRRAMDNLGNKIQDAFDTTTCNSTVYGGSVSTTCY